MFFYDFISLSNRLNTLKVAWIKEYHVITRNTKIKKANKWNKEK